MAQLPDENVIAMPQPGSRRPVSSIDASGYARGAAAVGSGIETLGKGITSAAQDVGAALRAQREAQAAAQGKVEQARAKAAFNVALINQGNAIEQATDPAGLPEKVRAEVGERAEIARQAIKDPREQGAFMLAARMWGARLVNTAAARADHLARESGKAADIATLNALAEGAIRSSDPEAVPMAMQSASDVIDGWGWMDRREADMAKALFAQDFALRKFNALPLSERYAAFGGGRYAELLAAMPVESYEQKRMATRREFEETRAKASYDALDATRRTLDDATNGLAPLPAWESIATNTDLQPADRDRARALYDTAVMEVEGFERFMTRFKGGNRGSFNRLDTKDRKHVDRAFAHLGGNAPALQAVVTQTGILPPRAAAQLHGAMMSDDPKRVADALTISANLYTADSNIFIGSDSQSEFESNAVAFRYYVDELGVTADEAARRIIRDRSPEYQASLQARLKAENVDQRLGRALHAVDIEAAFDQVPWLPFTDPNVGFDRDSRKVMFGQYTEVVRERYLQTGNFMLAKKQAIDQLKRIWGVTRVNDSQTVMPYPPERAPAYAGIENAADLIAAHVVETIKAGTGEDVPRSAIRLAPIPGVTAAQYKSGRTPSYLLMWTDKRGNTQMLQEGKAFAARPDVLRAVHDETERRNFELYEQAFDAAQSNEAAMVWGGS